MSVLVPRCLRCNLERMFVRILGVGNERVYGVEWKCPRCDDHLLDLCPVGPLVLTPEACLSCGHFFADLDKFARCPECGVTRLGAIDMFGLDPPPDDPVKVAGLLMDLGLVRRAIATLNDALRRDPSLEPVWRVKYSFLSGLGFNNAALAVIEAAMEFIVNPDLLISYAHLLRGLNQVKEAKDVYREYLATAPRGEYADLARGAILALDGAGQ